MAGFIPDEIVDRVRSATDIVDLVSEYVSLKKAGANYLGLCPFHNEKTPSFTVSPSKQIYHCFGCGAGGDAVGFLIRHDNYTFPEAVRRLADRAGIEIPETGQTAGRDRGELEAIIRANEAAAAYFGRALRESTEGEKARRYLDGRGFGMEQAEAFSLGYSMPSWDGLLKHLEKAGISAALAEKAGLAIRKQGGQGHYDRFRDRLMFLIRDVRGRAVGFGGRALDDSEPKYLNSPETLLFKKGETLYLADTSGEHIRKRGFAIVTEGYFDAIACHRAGAKNAVATLGTALTSMHLRLLGRFSKNALLVFDSDAAGIKAAQRSLDVFLSTGMTAKVALLPPGDDPDSLVAREGAAGLKKWLAKSDKLLDFVLGRLAEGAKTVDEKVAASKNATEVLAKIPNAVERSQYLGVAAGLLGVSEEALSEELDKALGRAGRASKAAAGTVGRRPVKKTAGQTGRIEEELVHLMLHFPEVALELKSGLDPADFADEALGRLAGKVLEAVADDGSVDVPALADAVGDEGLAARLTALAARDAAYEDPSESARGGVERLAQRREQRRLDDLKERIREAEENKDAKLLNKLQKEFVEWQKKKSWKK